MEYEKGDLVSYHETFTTTAAPGKTTERDVTDITYDSFGRTTGLTDVTHEYGSGLDSTVKTVRSDMVYDGFGNLETWTDTIQINAFSKEAREKTIKTLLNIAELCDGVRCDMAMLLNIK